MKKIFFTSVLLLLVFISFAQSNLNIFNGNLDQALIEANNQNKDLFVITKSYGCPVFKTFEENINSHLPTIEYLNNTFLIYIYDKDTTSKEEDKRMKKYFRWYLGFPQLNIIDQHEEKIVEFNYPLQINQDEHLVVWKKYKTFQSDWKQIKKNKKKIGSNYDELIKFLIYRQIDYSAFELYQIKHALARYFKASEPTTYADAKNWILFEKYITLGFNSKEFDLVAQNRNQFQSINGETTVSNYLFENYLNFIKYQKAKKVTKLSKVYPYNTIPEAIKAVDAYWEYHNTEKLPQTYSTLK